MRSPGIEPGSITWQATIITTRPRTLIIPALPLATRLAPLLPATSSINSVGRVLVLWAKGRGFKPRMEKKSRLYNYAIYFWKALYLKNSYIFETSFSGVRGLRKKTLQVDVFSPPFLSFEETEDERKKVRKKFLVLVKEESYDSGAEVSQLGKNVQHNKH